MSYVPGFGMPSENSGDYRHEKQRVYAPSDDDDDAAEKMPWESTQAYTKCFHEVLNGAFGIVVDKARALAEYGFDFAAFAKESGALLEKGVDDQAVAVHVICTQYARATGLESGEEWENIDNMRTFYTSGQLPRLVRAKRPRFDFTKTVAPEPLLTSEQFLQSKGVLSPETLEAMNELLQEHDLAASLPASRYTGLFFSCLSKSVAMREAEFRGQLEPFYVRLLSGKTAAPERSGYGGYGGYTGGAGYGENSAGSITEGDPDDRVTWTDVVRDMNLNVANEIQFLDDKTRQKLVANILRVKSSATEEDINQYFLMKCGAAFSMKHSRLVEKDKETNKNMYRRKLVPVMKEVIAQVKTEVFFLK